MAITGRVPLFLLVGLVPILLRPAMSTVWLWVLAVIGVVALDWFLAAQPASLSVSRSTMAPVRMGTETSTGLLVRNSGSRRVTALVRDAWQPSAGATGNRHTVRLASQDLITADAHPCAPTDAEICAPRGDDPHSGATRLGRPTSHQGCPRCGPVVATL